MFSTCLAAGASDIVLPKKAISYSELIRQLKDKGLIKAPTPPGPVPPPLLSLVLSILLRVFTRLQHQMTRMMGRIFVKLTQLRFEAD